MTTHVVHVDVSDRDCLLVDGQSIDQSLQPVLDLAMDLVDGWQIAEYLLGLRLVKDRSSYLVRSFYWLFEVLKSK